MIKNRNQLLPSRLHCKKKNKINDNKTLVKEEEKIIVNLISESTKFIFNSRMFDKMLASFILCNLIHSNQEAEQPYNVENRYIPDWHPHLFRQVMIMS